MDNLIKSSSLIGGGGEYFNLILQLHASSLYITIDNSKEVSGSLLYPLVLYEKEGSYEYTVPDNISNVYVIVIGGGGEGSCFSTGSNKAPYTGISGGDSFVTNGVTEIRATGGTGFTYDGYSNDLESIRPGIGGSPNGKDGEKEKVTDKSWHSVQALGFSLPGSTNIYTSYGYSYASDYGLSPRIIVSGGSGGCNTGIFDTSSNKLLNITVGKAATNDTIGITSTGNTDTCGAVGIYSL